MFEEEKAFRGRAGFAGRIPRPARAKAEAKKEYREGNSVVKAGWHSELGKNNKVPDMQKAGLVVVDVRLSSVDIHVKRTPGDAESISVLELGGTTSIALVRYNYAQGQALRVWRDLGAGASWADASADEFAPNALLQIPHAVTLLPSAYIDSEHKRFSDGLREQYSTFIDAFSGETLDLKTQTATVQYQTGEKRSSVLREGNDFEDVGAAAHERQRRGSAVAELHSGGVDASKLLNDVSAQPIVWESGNFGSQPCALVVGPAASGKTTLMRRFIVDALDVPGIVPLFLAVIDLVPIIAAARDHSRCITDECIASQSDKAGALRARFLAQAVAERRVLFLIDGMDEAGAMRDAVEAFVAEELVGRGHRVVVSSRESGFSDKLQRVLESSKHQVVQLLPLSAAQQHSMISARLEHEQAMQLMAQVVDPRLAELAENPLMLTMMLSVFKRMGGKLPAKRSELYKNALDAMLDRADAARKQRQGGHATGGSQAELEAFVQQLAYLSHRRQGGQFRVFTATQASGGLQAQEVEEMQRAVPGRLQAAFGSRQTRKWALDTTSLARTRAHEASDRWQDAVELVHAHAFPILVSLGTGRGGEPTFRFSHLTFQEYFAARELVDRFISACELGRSTESVSALLRKAMLQGDKRCAAHALEDPRWHLVLDVSMELCDTEERREQFAQALLAGCGEKLVLRAGAGATVLGNLLLAAGRTTLKMLKLNVGELPIHALQTAESLDLSGKQLQPTDAIIIAKFLSMANAALTDLNLRNNGIGVEGAEAIAAVLPRCVLLQNGMHPAPSDARN